MEATQGTSMDTALYSDATLRKRRLNLWILGSHHICRLLYTVCFDGVYSDLAWFGCCFYESQALSQSN